MKEDFRNHAIETAARKVELLELLQQLEEQYCDLLKVARSNWERAFNGKDPSDACVTIRIDSGIEADVNPKRTVRGSGIIRKPRSSSSPNGKTRKRFA